MCNEGSEMCWPNVDTVPSSKNASVQDGITAFPHFVRD